MPFATHQEQIRTTLDAVWALLLDKIERPENYVPGVLESRIIERDETGILREMTTASLAVTERITVDERAHRIRFELVEHPRYRGHVDNVLEASSDPGEVSLTFVLEWELKDEDDLQEDMLPAIREAVLRTKQQAEGRAETEQAD